MPLFGNIILHVLCEVAAPFYRLAFCFFLLVLLQMHRIPIVVVFV